ncbi:MAG TPA: acyltransferase [Chthoniobacteraceae bacterium]|nr:acyltransferase [Chthoniobacteraceae bacterium]
MSAGATSIAPAPAPRAPARDKSHHIAEIDALRGLGMFGILAVHMDSYVPWFHYIPGIAEGWGIMAMALFFIISGYAITLSLKIHKPLRPGASPIKAFMVRRLWRVQPLVFCWIGFVLFGTCFLNSTGYFGTMRENSTGALFVFLIMANWRYVTKAGLGAFGIYWSFSVEEQFYLVYPFLMFKVRNRRAVLYGLGAAMLLLMPIFNVLALNWFLPKYSLAREFLLAVWWYQCILAGIGVYALAGDYMRHFSPRYDKAIRLFALFLLAVVPIPFALKNAPLLITTTSPEYAMLASGFVVFAAVLSKRNAPFPATKFLAWFGARSFGLYLAHFPCGIVNRIIWSSLVPGGKNPGTFLTCAAFASFIMLVFGITEILHRLVEKPAMAMGHRISKRMLEDVYAPAAATAVAADAPAQAS